jgi:hypothetical protein
LDEQPQAPREGKHRRLYDESLVHNIMLAAAYCVKDLLEENPDLDDEDIYEFIEENYQGIIADTLEEYQKQQEEFEDELEDGELNGFEDVDDDENPDEEIGNGGKEK